MKKQAELLKTEIALSYVLRYGVLFCASIIAIGLIKGWLNPSAHEGMNKEILTHLMAGERFPNDEIPRDWASIHKGLASFESNAIICFGLLSLVALPIFRVAMTMILFLRKKDYIYVCITSVVLIILLGSIFLGKGL